mgnify:CR=1 FL=1
MTTQIATKKVEEVVVKSDRFELNKWDFKKWIENQRSFLAPMGVLYLAFVITNVGNQGISFSDFVPSNGILSAMALYVLNALYDLFRKWSDEKKYIVAK